VSDTGIGIATTMLEHIFESFSQADGTTTRRFGGTGLGLTISRQLSAIMGGELSVESEEGKGSSFSFTARFKPGPPIAGKTPAQELLTGKRVLIVGDNATNRKILEFETASWQMTSVAVDCGPSALETLREQHLHSPFDVALLDLNMPDMDGIQLAEAIMDNPLYNDIKVIVLTSAGNYGDADRTRRAGVAAYLGKPVRSTRLCECLAAVLTGRVSATLRRPSDPVHQPRREKYSILLVEDNPVNQSVCISMLNTLGYGSGVAANGVEALELLAHTHYDLVLMDCQMPIMDGYDATRLIREKEQTADGAAPTRHVPIVALTAHALEGDREKAINCGMNDYLSKPFTMDQLAAMLDHWLSGRDGLAELPASTFTAGSEAAILRGDNASPVDRDVLNGILMFDGMRCQEVIDKVLLRFIATVPETLDKIRSALAADEVKTVEIAAHSLKSSSGMIGALRLSTLFKNLELDARKCDLTSGYAILAAIETEFQRVRAVLEEVCAE
jgi:CheY-like chemotaxis protein/HPt (histidine-containing phosphotransfer) domain-containing protein